jgi:hypothetical protein
MHSLKILQYQDEVVFVPESSFRPIENLKLSLKPKPEEQLAVFLPADIK